MSKKKAKGDTWEKLYILANDYSEEYYEESYELLQIRDEEIIKSYEHPTCCDQSKNLWYHVSWDISTDKPTNNGEPFWYMDVEPPRKTRNIYAQRFEIKFCPFCGTKLPGFVLKKIPPKHLAIMEPYHCGNCGERYCFCDPAELAWEIDKGK
jgi:hypothetical protein